MDEKLPQKLEWQVISNTCCLPFLCFVLLKSFPIHALSLFSRFIGRLEKQLGFQQRYYIVFAT